jgi:hypothetical protein
MRAIEQRGAHSLQTGCLARDPAENQIADTRPKRITIYENPIDPTPIDLAKNHTHSKAANFLENRGRASRQGEIKAGRDSSTWKDE